MKINETETGIKLDKWNKKKCIKDEENEDKEIGIKVDA